MLKYIALVSLCAGAVCAADFITGQAARAVVGQPSFTAQVTASQTSTTTLAGTVNTSGTAVTLVSGQDFPATLLDNAITINGKGYTVTGWTSSTLLTVAADAGTQSAVAYSATINSTAYGCTGIPPVGLCFNKTYFGAMGGVAYVNNTLFAADANNLGFQPSNNRVLLINNINGKLPADTAEIPPYSGRCPVCVDAATLELDDVDANGQPLQGLVTPTQTGTRQPTAVATDGVILAVADTGNNRVLLWKQIPTSDHQPADVVLGQPNFTTLQPLAVTASAMRGPQGVWIQGTRLIVADTGNNRILIWNTIPSINNQSADVVLGQPNFTSAPPVDQLNLAVPATSNTMLSPVSATSDGHKLYVADLGFNRVLIWNNIPTTNQQPADLVLGQKDFLSSVPNDVTNLCTATLNSIVNVSTVTNTTQQTTVTGVQQNVQINTITVTWVSGPTFPSTITSSPVVINGITYLVNGWISTTQFTVAQVSPTPVTLTNASLTNFPTECGATMNFPRAVLPFTLKDGQPRLFVADGGNDRVLVFNMAQAPIKSAAGFNAYTAYAVLGQVDPFTDSYSSSSALVTSAADSTPTPTGLAWDPVNYNLYVVDPSDYRITVFTPEVSNVSANEGVVNAASRAVYAAGSISVGGTIRVQDVATVTIAGTAPASATTLATDCVIAIPCYQYIVKTGDTVDLIAKGLAAAINAGNDPNVLAFEDTGTAVVRLQARVPGANGNNITIATTVGPNDKVSLTTSGSSLSGGGNSAEVGPGTLLLINGQNLSDSSGSAPLTAQLPFVIAGTEVYVDGMRAPMFLASPTQLGVVIPWAVFGANSASLWVRTAHSDGTVTVTNPIGLPIVDQNPGIFACNPAKPIDPTNPFACDPNGTEPRAAIAMHTSDFASAIVSVGGGIQNGDVATLTLNGLPYSYYIQTTDTVQTVRDALIGAVNADPNSQVIASATPVAVQILLTAKVARAAGSGVPITTAVSSTVVQGPQITLSTTKTATCCYALGGSGTLVTQNNPAIPGETIAIYGAGLGLVEPEVARVTLNDGTPYNGPPGDTARTDPSTTAGSGSATVISAGLTNMVGIYQIVMELSTSLNPNALAQLTISQGGTSNVVTIPIQAPNAAFLTVTLPTGTTITSGTAFNFTVTASDPFNNPVANYSGTVHFTSSDPAAVLPVDSSLSGGTGTFGVTLNTSGTQTISAIDTLTGITGTGTFVVP